jgi:hypothetical protein
MGSNNSSGGGGNNNTYTSSREIGIMNQYKAPAKRAADTQRDKEKAFQEQGAYSTRRNVKGMLPGATKVAATILSPTLEKNAVRTRKFFTDYVLGEGGKKNSLYAGMNKSQFQSLSVEKQNEMYSEYSKNRMSGTRDAYGREVIQGGDGGAMTTSGQVVQAPQPVASPTTAEVSQVSAAEVEDPILLRKKKTLARGRSLTIQTSPKGASGDLTLGKPSLLGR